MWTMTSTPSDDTGEPAGHRSGSGAGSVIPYLTRSQQGKPGDRSDTAHTDGISASDPRSLPPAPPDPTP
jgi:hypothetical protein